MTPQHLIPRALVLSLLCHLIVFSTVIFTFETSPAAYKPKLVFLGSILPGQDILVLKPGQTVVYGNLTTKEFLNRTVVARLFSQNRNIRKPHIDLVTSFSGKTIMKSFFKLPSLERNENLIDVKETDIRINITPYKSLKAR